VAGRAFRLTLESCAIILVAILKRLVEITEYGYNAVLPMTRAASLFVTTGVYRINFVYNDLSHSSTFMYHQSQIILFLFLCRYVPKTINRKYFSSSHRIL
jgi:hypothetical protein